MIIVSISPTNFIAIKLINYQQEVEENSNVAVQKYIILLHLEQLRWLSRVYGLTVLNLGRFASLTV